MNMTMIADLVGQLTMAGLALGMISIVLLCALRRRSVNSRLLGYTFLLMASILIFILIAGGEIYSQLQSPDIHQHEPLAQVPAEESSASVVLPLPYADRSEVELPQSRPSSNHSELKTPPYTQSIWSFEVPAAFTLPLTVFGFIWGSGTLVLLGYWVKQNRQLGEIVRTATPIQAEAGLCSNKIKILLSQSKNTAFCCGVLKPSIVIPKDLYEDLTEDDRNLIIQHEMVHLKAGDQYLIHIQFFAIALFWWLPTIWLLGQHLIAACEQRCDSVVIQRNRSSKRYAELLLKVAALPFAPPYKSSLPISRKYKETKKRIENILMNNYPYSPITTRQKWMTSTITVTTTVVLFYLSSQFTIADEPMVKAPPVKLTPLQNSKEMKVEKEPVVQPANELTITCEGGVTFETQTNMITYRKNVVFTYLPLAITLSAQDEIKVTVGNHLVNPNNLPNNMEDVVTLVASGGVRASFRSVKGDIISVAGSAVVYDGKSKALTVRGGFPTITVGTNKMTAVKADQQITIRQDGSVVAEGGWVQSFTIR